MKQPGQVVFSPTGLFRCSLYFFTQTIG